VLWLSCRSGLNAFRWKTKTELDVISLMRLPLPPEEVGNEVPEDIRFARR
jgi:hypothetical protein